jgi:hypothetical protein
VCAASFVQPKGGITFPPGHPTDAISKKFTTSLTIHHKLDQTLSTEELQLTSSKRDQIKLVAPTIISRMAVRAQFENSNE